MPPAQLDRDFWFRAAKAVGRHASFILFGLVFVLLAAGAIKDRPGTGAMALTASLLLFMAVRLAYLGYRYVHDRDERLPTVQAFESGGLVLTFLYVVVAMTGGLASSFHPLVYLAIVILTAFHRPLIGAGLVAYAIAYEAGVTLSRGAFAENALVVGSHAAFIVAFGSLQGLLRRFNAVLERTKAHVQVKEILGRIEDDAKRFRLASATNPGASGAEHDRKQDLSTYFEIHEVLQDILRTLSLAHNAFTAAVLLFEESRRTLRVVDAYSSAASLRTDEFPADQGVLLGVVKTGEALRLALSQDGVGRLLYYRRPEPVRTFLAQPIKDGQRLVGILVVDRAEEKPFTDEETELAAVAARQVHRAMVNESLLRSLDKGQQEYFHLSEASKLLSRALDRTSVLNVSLAATHAIAAYDLGAVVMRRPTLNDYEIVAASPFEGNLVGMTFSGEQNLVDWVVRKNQSLVYGDFDDLPRRPVIFSPDERLRDLSSLLIVPLYVKADAAGAFVMASSQRHFFTADLQHIFQIIANQIAVRLENAEIYGRLEEMAVTDGLTGLHNKRFFTERLDEIISRAERYEHKLAMMVLDIDHFKRVNDTYGHPVGDRVLREVARVLRESMRKTDLVARFGGEEFIVLLDAADHGQAYSKAEELRDVVAGLEFDTDLGKFGVQASFGIAVFPDDTRVKDELLERADVALYQSKRLGRNRTTLYRDL
ncbi:MAG: GGDEF domain-containing protein [Myxococcales bacterium]|nr:MAG: GGDEF domain-containing protein [Myxococcales bacterium]